MPSKKTTQRKKVEETEVEKRPLTRKSLEEMRKDIAEKNMYPEMAKDLYPEMVQNMYPEMVQNMYPEMVQNMYPEVVQNMYPEVVQNMYPEVVQNLYPEMLMDFEENSSSQEDKIYKEYQRRCVQNQFAEKSPVVRLLQNPLEGAHQFPTSTNDVNDSQFRTNRNEKVLPMQPSGSDSMEEESSVYLAETTRMENQQNTSKKARQDKPVDKISHIDQSLHKDKSDSNLSGSAKPRKLKRKSQKTLIANQTISFTKKEQSLFSFKYLWWIIPLLLVIIRTFVLTDSLYANQEKNLFNATDVVLNLQAEFGKQPNMSYRIIYSALKKVSEGKSDAPAIIVLLAANGSETVCNNFAHRFQNLLPCPYNNVQLVGEDYISSSINNAKKEIDDSLKVLKDNELSSVLVEDLDRIPGEVALIFHTYWDHENAPYKQSVFIMTVTHGKAINKNDPKAWDKALQDHLYSAWSDTGVDQISALLSRLTVSVVAIVG